MSKPSGKPKQISRQNHTFRLFDSDHLNEPVVDIAKTVKICAGEDSHVAHSLRSELPGESVQDFEKRFVEH